MIRIQSVRAYKKWHRLHTSCSNWTCRSISGRAAAVPWRVLFFGSDDFSLRHVQALHSNLNSNVNDGRLVKELSVVSGSRNPVQRYAATSGLDVHAWPPADDLQFDIGVLASFGHLIPKRVIQQFPLGIINVHPSLLPRWRGAAPLLHTLLSGETHTGISITQIVPHRFDTGPILAQRPVTIDGSMACGQLTSLMAEQGSRLLLEVLKDLSEDKITATEQSSGAVSHAPRVNVENANVNWQADTVEQIDRQYRALDQFSKLRSVWNGIRVKLLDMVPLSDMQDINMEVEKALQKLSVNPQPGHPMFIKKYDVLCIKCKNDWVAFKGIIIRKPQSAREFHSGYLQQGSSNMINTVQNPQQILVFESAENGLDQFEYYRTCGNDSRAQVGQQG